MRRLLAILIGGGAVLGAAPFSHKLHLQMKLQCTGCHAAATTSTRVEDNLLPDKEACRPCHQDRQIPAPPTTMVAHFNHAQHLKLGNAAPKIAAAIDRKEYLQPAGDTRRFLDTSNACEACHRGLEESEQVSHDNLPRMADCLVCHGDRIQPPFTCMQCHVKDPALKPASHNSSFIDDHSAGKLKLDKTTCAVCHGREFTCMGCH